MQYNQYALDVEQCGGLDKVEAMQHHPNMDVYKKALSIIEVFFGEGEGEDDTSGM